MRRPRRPARDLRFAIDCLPRRTRVAMLEAIDQSRIIVGAYTDGRGGVCPMLGAHRRGGRNDLASFARAWDRYTGATKRSREAKPRELRTLRSMLETSLVADGNGTSDLARAAADIETIKARRSAAERRPKGAGLSRRRMADTGERDRSEELGRRPGWAWLRVFRRYDEFQAAVERAGHAERAVEPRELELIG